MKSAQIKVVIRQKNQEEGIKEEFQGVVRSKKVVRVKGSDPTQGREITAEVEKTVEVVSDTAQIAKEKGKEAVAEDSTGYSFYQLLDLNTTLDLTLDKEGLDGSMASSDEHSPATKGLTKDFLAPAPQLSHHS